jgi:tripartite-type tricarboxylate transporter receptor subunit TctC
MPDVPTTVEAGLNADSIYPFYSGFFVPAKTPREVIERLHRESAEALKAPQLQARFKTLGVQAMTMNLEELAAFFKEDVAAALELAKAAKLDKR